MGSCSRADFPQRVWAPLSALRPDLFVWLGDIVYADKRVRPFVFESSTEAEVAAKFHELKSNPEYRAFLATGTPVIGVWDDHDYNLNDGGKEAGTRAMVQPYLLNFLDVPTDSPLRTRDGVYSATTIGEPGRQIRIILLDGRSHRDARHRGDPEQRDILGEEQWRWLEAELMDPAQRPALTIVGSGVQIVAPDKSFVEGWHNFPGARRRLFKLLHRASAASRSAVMLASGDVHFGEVTEGMVCDEAGSCLRLVDATTSGLTHSVATSILSLFGLVPRFVFNRLFNAFVPARLRVGEPMLDHNFGTVTVDWARQAVSVALRAVDGPEVVAFEWPLSALRVVPATPGAQALAAATMDIPLWRMVRLSATEFVRAVLMGIGAIAAAIVTWRVWVCLRRRRNGAVGQVASVVLPVEQPAPQASARSSTAQSGAAPSVAE